MDFGSFCRAHGLRVDWPIADGHWHRVATEDHPRKRNGAYRWTGEVGWCQNWASMLEPAMYRDESATVADSRDREAIRRRQREETAKTARQHAMVAADARLLLSRAELAGHPYLLAKGFPKAQGLVHDDVLLIPMRDHKTDDLVNVQRIAADGTKRFMPGGRAGGCVHRLGPRKHARGLWLCEGYATGLSLLAAAQSMMMPLQVVVCFSANNMAAVADHFKGVTKVMADNDASGTGERVARSIGYPWVMPPDVGDDANDLHQKSGVRALVKLMQSV